MSEVTFSKKQLSPLMEKYSIAPSNETFNMIIELFNGQTNYQIWAIKLVFGEGVDINIIKNVHAWASTHPNDIQHLTKQNIVSYNSESKLGGLLEEILGLEKLSFVKNAISKFNTTQRELLRNGILNGIENGIQAIKSAKFNKWHGHFTRLERMPQDKRQNVINLASALTNFTALEKYVVESLQKSYVWNREDMLDYMRQNAKDCTVTYDKDGVVVINVPSFASSVAMCGNGRTAWCLTREERFFNQYVTDIKGAKQYMLFNFNLREKDELAHIGFTVRPDTGISNAHSGKNQLMTGGGCDIDGKIVTIGSALNAVGVPKSIYLQLKDMKLFAWNKESVLAYVNKHNVDYAVSLDEGSKLIIRVLTNNGFKELIGHSLIDPRCFSADGKTKFYVVFDFALAKNDDTALAVLKYNRDEYDTETLSYARDLYNCEMEKKSALKTLGIDPKKFLNCEKIHPTILLHKYINEGREEDALSLIAESGVNFDVNFEFNNVIPIFATIHKRMCKLFSAIINHPKFDKTVTDGFGETLLQSLIYSYKVEGVTNAESDAVIKIMIDTILAMENYDFNVLNLNLDTAINIACEDTKYNWILDVLIANPNVKLNEVNDFNCAALGNAIRHKNKYALKALATRSDVIIREYDEELANKHGINLDEFFGTVTVGEIAESKSNASELYAELFAKAYARVHA